MKKNNGKLQILYRNKRPDTRKIAVAAVLAALEIALGFIGNYVSFGQVNLNLALIPVIVAACFYGPVMGLILGLLNGCIALCAPTTIGFFMPYNPVATVFLCLLKTGAAGFIAGFIYRAFAKKHEYVGVIVASISVPVINTGIFIAGVYAFFLDLYASINVSGVNVFEFVLLSVLTVNFAVEVCSTAVLSPAVYKILKITRRNSFPSAAESSDEDNARSENEDDNE